MDCSVPGFPVLQEFAQTHVHWVGNAIYISRYRYFTTEAELGPSNQEDGYTLEISILSIGNDRMIFCFKPGQYSLLSWVPDLKKYFQYPPENENQLKFSHETYSYATWLHLKALQSSIFYLRYSQSQTERPWAWVKSFAYWSFMS